MRIWTLALIGALVAALAPAVADADPASRFDGGWSVTVTCPSGDGAMGFSYKFPAEVRGGVLHGERLHEGEPGWLVIDGPIGDDGRARFYANGLVGAAPFAVGQRPRGTPYGYHVDARFEPEHGAGRRVEGRPCDLDFVRR